MPRPYLPKTIDKLEEWFEEHSASQEILIKLEAELAYRTSARAEKLRERVQAALRKLQAAPSEQADEEFVEEEVEDDDHQDSSDEFEDDEEDFDQDESDFSDSGADQLSLGLTEAASSFPPDDRHRPSSFAGIRPVGTAGLPPAWKPTLDQSATLQLPPNADLPQRYCAALAALIAEIKKTGSGQKRYELEKGVRIEGHADKVIYSFAFTEEAGLFEDAMVEVELPGQRVDASIVSISSGRLLLAVEQDLGPTLHRAVIVVDPTALLEALREKVELAGRGELTINRALADAVVGAVSHPPSPSPIPYVASPDPLNAAQTKAVQKALSDSVTYIWGPPGTGKTHVLGDIVRSAFENGKRVLVCSNTNKAVDQVLLKICRRLGKHHRAMEGGKILRLGTIALDVLRSDFEDYVTVDGIVNRKSVELKERQLRLQNEIKALDARTARTRILLDQFIELDSMERAVGAQKEETNTLAKKGRELKAEREALSADIAKLEAELAKPRGGIVGWFKRSESSIREEIAQKQGRRQRVLADIEQTSPAYAEARARFDRLVADRDRRAQALAGADRKAAQREIEVADFRRAPLTEELREVEAKLADMRAAVMKEAMVLGATCTKTYLSSRDFGQVDIVIVDEASMVLLPMIWFAAGQANERAVVCGDFRQLPPIVPTSSQAIFDVLGADVFAASGLDAMREGDTRMVKLQSQYRMEEPICQLIARPMYETLITVKKASEHPSPPAPYDQPLTIIDTSELWPFESVNPYKSRFNLMHALLVRNLVWFLNGKNHIRSREDFAVCTPYAAQARLLRKILEQDGLGELVHVGTVHSFQGDERRAVLLELPESYGSSRGIGQFLQGVPPDHVGARLINVALSRAQNHLYVLANLTHLDPLLPSSALLRSVLYEMQQKGRVISGKELLALRPIQSDLRGLVGQVDLDFDAKNLGLFDGPGFEKAVRHDISHANESAVLFSGFITPARVAALGDLFRLKISEGVGIRCVTRPPHLNGSVDPAQGEQALNVLESIGCVVDLRAKIHEKIVLVDKEIVWHGSLNILSHNHRTDESMTRVVNPGFAQTVAASMSKRRVANDAAVQAVVSAENPRCGDCGSRSYYDEGRFGPYFCCEKKCGWTESLKYSGRNSTRSSTPVSDLPQSGPACPKCRGETRLRNGKYGPFYGCTKYPACKGIAKPNGGKKRKKANQRSGRKQSKRRA